MNEHVQSAAQVAPTSARLGELKKVLLILLRTVPAVAVACLMLFTSIGHVRLSQSGTVLLSTLIYCTLIALPSGALLTSIAHRFSEKHARLMLPLNIAALIATSTCGTLLGASILQWIGINRPSEYWLEFSRSYPISIVISLIVGLGSTSFETMRYKLQAATLELRNRQVEQERAYKLLAEARLSSLESRIHPHFLFNTLNSIAALIPSDPQRAEDTVGKLASLLRFSLNANQGGLVPLAQELKVVRDYLEIERTRFGQRLRYEIAVPGTLDEVRVPPLALQLLVENAVKHVVSKRPEGATIRLSGGIVDGHAQLSVSDDGPGFLLDAISPEHGLGNLIARLELLFGSEGKLDVARSDGRTNVSLMFPA